MTSEKVILQIEKSQFIVKLDRDVLQVDLREGVMKELEDVLEATPDLRDNLGFLFQTLIPLDVSLKDIERVDSDENGVIKIIIPNRRDILLPLDVSEAEQFKIKLHELIPLAKQRYIERLLASQKAEEEVERDQWRYAGAHRRL
ncbi:MAG: hypothetical protein ACXADH_12765 [Candidatus Kariarchaeaceae archaeon]